MLCKCGCGQQTRNNNKWILGHNSRFKEVSLLARQNANISGVLINWTPIITDVRYAYMKKPKVTSTGTKPVMGVINEQQLSIKKPTGLRGTYQKDNYNVDSS